MVESLLLLPDLAVPGVAARAPVAAGAGGVQSRGEGALLLALAGHELGRWGQAGHGACLRPLLWPGAGHHVATGCH